MQALRARGFLSGLLCSQLHSLLCLARRVLCGRRSRARGLARRLLCCQRCVPRRLWQGLLQGWRRCGRLNLRA
jgi:hypothetical protein